MSTASGFWPDPPQDQFQTLFCGPDGVQTAYDKAAAGELLGVRVRSIVWKVFFGLVDKEQPVDDWPATLATHRQRYQELLDKHVVDPHKEEPEDLVVNNPLSTASESTWNKYFKNTELEKEIQKDIDRTHPENDFFQREDVKEMMREMLFLYARENEQTSYRQGMHELLAPILYITEREAVQEQDGSVYAQLLDRAYLVPDTYLIFERLMHTACAWYRVSDLSPSQRAALSKEQREAAEQDEQQAPIKLTCDHIQNTILADRDPALHAHLTAMEIQPQLYGLRWVRLLFGREFHLEDVIVLWDGLFADSASLELVPYVAVAMLAYIREQLLERDYSMCLKRLFKYPPVESVHAFIVTAKKIRDSDPGPMWGINTSSGSSSGSSSSAKSNQTDEAEVSLVRGRSNTAKRNSGRKTKARKNKASNIVSSFGDTLTANTRELFTSMGIGAEPNIDPSAFARSRVTTNQVGGASSSASQYSASSASRPHAHPEFGLMESRQELTKLRQMMQRQGARLNEAILLLQRELLSAPAADDAGDATTSSYDQAAVFMALAEMKQVRDIITFQIEDDGWQEATGDDTRANPEIVRHTDDADTQQQDQQQQQQQQQEEQEEQVKYFDPLGAKRVEDDNE